MNFLKKLFGNSKPKLPECPYCGYEFEKMPSRKRKCPECNETIHNRKDSKTNESILLTESGLKEWENEKEEIRRKSVWEELINSQVELGNRYKYNKDINEKLRGELESLPFNSRQALDRMWQHTNKVLNQFAIKTDFLGMSEAYSQQVKILKFEGRDYFKILAELNHWRGAYQIENTLKTTGLKIKAVWLAADDNKTCKNCAKLDGETFTLKQWIEEKPHVKHQCTNDFCRCTLGWADEE